MSIIHLKDRGGENITLMEVGDVRVPKSFPADVHPDLPKLKMRDDDVIIAARPRSVDTGSWFDHVRDWEKVFETHPNLEVCFCYYENMKKNPVEELRKVSEFLGLDTNESLLQAIVDKCLLDRMREDKYKYEWLEKGVAVHYMKGLVGAWKELFTAEQYEIFEKTYRENMAGSKFEERYKGPVLRL